MGIPVKSLILKKIYCKLVKHKIEHKNIIATFNTCIDGMKVAFI